MTFWWLFHRRDELIDTLIRSPKYKFTGLDEAARKRTAQRRQRAADMRSEATQIDVGHEAQGKYPRRA